MGGPKVVCLGRHNYATLFHSFMGVDSRDMTHHFPLFLDAFEMGPTFSLIPHVCLQHLTNRARFQIFIGQTHYIGRKNMLISPCSITLPGILVILYQHRETLFSSIFSCVHIFSTAA